MKEFARQAAETYADPRGWRNAGVVFKRVRGASDFSLVLAEASWLPRFSSTCSVQWSCRAGRYVVINQLAGSVASPSWNAARARPSATTATSWSTTRPATGSATATSAVPAPAGWPR